MECFIISAVIYIGTFRQCPIPCVVCLRGDRAIGSDHYEALLGCTVSTNDGSREETPNSQWRSFNRDIIRGSRWWGWDGPITVWFRISDEEEWTRQRTETHLLNRFWFILRFPLMRFYCPIKLELAWLLSTGGGFCTPATSLSVVCRCQCSFPSPSAVLVRFTRLPILFRCVIVSFFSCPLLLSSGTSLHMKYMYVCKK